MGLSVYSRPYKELRGLAIGLDEAGAFPLRGRYISKVGQPVKKRLMVIRESASLCWLQIHVDSPNVMNERRKRRLGRP